MRISSCARAGLKSIGASAILVLFVALACESPLSSRSGSIRIRIVSPTGLAEATDISYSKSPSMSVGGSLAITLDSGRATVTGPNYTASETRSTTTPDGQSFQIEINDVPPGTGYTITVEGFSGGQVLYSGSASGVTVTENTTTTATISNFEPQVASVTVSPDSITLASIGATGQLTAQARNAQNTAFTGLINTDFSWSSLAGGTAQVTNGGLVTALADGSSQVVASLAGMKADTVTVVVNQQATNLAYTVEPGSTLADSTIAPAVRVTARDALGNAVTKFTGNVSIALGTNPGAGALSGTLTVAAVTGVATFSNLSIDAPASGYTLTATASGLTNANSAPFTVMALPATKLAITTGPSTTVAGSTITPAIRVAAQNASSNTVTTFTGNVTVALAANPGSGTLSGTLTVAAVNGVATFSNLSINTPGTGYTLTVTASGLTNATSAAFNITPAPATKLAFTTSPSASVAGGTITPVIQVAAQDASSNLVPTFTGNVTIALSNNPGSGSLAGTLSVAAQNGVATFSNLSISSPGSGYSLSASATDLTGATSAAFDVASAWTWMAGSSIPNNSANHGVLGVAAPVNTPGGRTGAATWVKDGLLWLFGGEGRVGGTTGAMNDLWKFDGTAWIWVGGPTTLNHAGTYGQRNVPAGSNIPPSRQGAVSWLDINGNMWMFGGYVGGGGYLNDLWRFDGNSWTWVSGTQTLNHEGVYATAGTPDPANVPAARSGAVYWIDGTNLWLFGGGGVINGSGDLNDLWRFDGTNWTWVKGNFGVNQSGNYGSRGVTAASNIPPSRFSAVSWKDATGNFWLFGGTRGTSYLNDLWKFDGTDWTWISGSNSPNQPGAYGTKGQTSGSNVPGARYQAVAWALGNNLLLFGGNYSTGSFNDLWRFDGVNWTWIAGSSTLDQFGTYGEKGTPTANTAPGGRVKPMVWVDGAGTLWLFGGNGYASGSSGLLDDLWKWR